MPAASARTKCACVVTTISQVNLVCRQRPARSKVLAHGHQAGRQVQCAWGYFRDANTGAGQGIIPIPNRDGGSTPPSCRVWVASIEAMQRTLNPQSTVRIRGNSPAFALRASARQANRKVDAALARRSA